jgi:hypothetical protein
VANVGAIGKQLLLQVAYDLVWRTGILRQWLREKLGQGSRLDIWEHAPFFDVLQIFGQQIHYAVSSLSKLLGIHESA